MVAGLLTRIRRRGFVGPRYSGVTGKIRFLWHKLVARTEVILVAEPGDGAAVSLAPTPLELRYVSNWDDFAPFCAGIDAEYHADYTAPWRNAFAEEKELVLGLVGGSVAGFGWVQTGKPSGTGCYYARLLTDDYRISQVGVVPSFRRRGINTSFYILLLNELFARGAQRVFIDCARDNTPSLRAQIRAGFRPIGQIRVLPLGGRNVIQWTPLNRSDLDRELGVGAERV